MFLKVNHFFFFGALRGLAPDEASHPSVTSDEKLTEMTAAIRRFPLSRVLFHSLDVLLAVDRLPGGVTSWLLSKRDPLLSPTPGRRRLENPNGWKWK